MAISEELNNNNKNTTKANKERTKIIFTNSKTTFVSSSFWLNKTQIKIQPTHSMVKQKEKNLFSKSKMKTKNIQQWKGMIGSITAWVSAIFVSLPPFTLMKHDSVKTPWAYACIGWLLCLKHDFSPVGNFILFSVCSGVDVRLVLVSPEHTRKKNY